MKKSIDYTDGRFTLRPAAGTSADVEVDENVVAAYEQHRLADAAWQDHLRLIDRWPRTA